MTSQCIHVITAGNRANKPSLLFAFSFSTGVAAGTNLLFPLSSIHCIFFHHSKISHIFYCRILPPFARSISFSPSCNYLCNLVCDMIFAPSWYCQTIATVLPCISLTIAQLQNTLGFLHSKFCSVLSHLS